MIKDFLIDEDAWDMMFLSLPIILLIGPCGMDTSTFFSSVFVLKKKDINYNVNNF
jgi:hypothetical protein